MKRKLTFFLFVVTALLSKAGEGYMGKSELFSVDLSKLVSEKSIDLEYSKIKSRRFGMSYVCSYVNSEYSVGGDRYFDFVAQPGGLTFTGGSIGIGVVYNSAIRNNILPNGPTNSFNIRFGYHKFTYEDVGSEPFKGNSSTIIATYKFRRNVKIASFLYVFYGLNFGMNIPLNKNAFDDERTEPYFAYGQSLNKRYFDEFIIPYFLNINYGITCYL